jgi:hypothetical protein
VVTLHYKQYVHSVIVTVVGFLLYFAGGTSVLRVSISNQPAHWDSSCLGATCLCSKCRDEIFLHAHRFASPRFYVKKVSVRLYEMHP